MQLTNRQKNNFLKKVVKTDSCWLWSGYKINNGYGRVNLNGVCYLTHRVSYEMSIGRIKKGMVVMHKCDVRNCVNPNHLQQGTSKDNAQDAKRKGRHWNGKFAGENNPNWKHGLRTKTLIV